MSDSQRITSLEERITFHERAFDQLNRIVAQQQLEIDVLQREVKDLRRQRLESSQDGTGGETRNLEDDRPPHY